MKHGLHSTALLLASLALVHAAEPAAPSDDAPPDDTALAAPLSKAVQRLADQEDLSASDLAELAHKTIAWGQRLSAGQAAKPVPEGPVRDALAAVGAGNALDPQSKAADWHQLRRDLEALLRTPPEQKKEEPPQSQKDEQKKDQKEQQEQKQPPQQKEEQKQQEQKPEEQKQSESKPQEQKPQNKDSAFGDMKQPEEKKQQPPPPPSSDMQQVGGSEKKPETEKADPATALQRQKLEQVKEQDSPVRLFQLMDDKKKRPQDTPGKNW